MIVSAPPNVNFTFTNDDRKITFTITKKPIAFKLSAFVYKIVFLF